MKVLVVYCHPLPTSFAAALLDRVVRTLERSGHDVHVDDLYAAEFDPRLTGAERLAHRDYGVAPELEPFADRLRWCDGLVLVYPTWWSGMPATLKGWIDRVWGRGVAWELPAGGSTVRGRLRNVRRLAVVTTHGSVKRVNWLEGQSGRGTVFRGLRVLCHPLVRTTWLALYAMDHIDDDARATFLERVERRFSRW